MKHSLNIFLLLTVAIFSLWCTGDLMRKNDQATILAGANDLAHGRMRAPSAYYQFDKTYMTYAVCAGIIKTQHLVRCIASPVAACNMGLALIFWSSLTIFAVRFCKTLSPLVLLCFLTAPAILLNTLYVNSTVLSSAFLLLSAVFLFREGSRGGWLAAIFFFFAVGARADAILLLPLLLWLITPLSISGKFRTNSPNVWKISVAGILALVTGRILCCGGASVDLFFNAKMVAGYTVFGFGAAGLLFLVCSFRLTAQVARGRSVFEKLYSFAGLAAFLLPVLFFIPQLHTPRYFWRGCEAVLLLAVSGRLPNFKFRAANYGLALAALLPLFSGVRLPELAHPQITVTKPSLFPSGDGFYPMGATGLFMLRLRNAAEYPVDHNQLVWNAVQRADFRFDDRRAIPVLYTPMYGYFMFEASLRGGFADCLPFAQLAGRPFYADSRSLMRDDPKTPLNELSDILDLPSRFVSSENYGISVLCFGEGNLQWGRQARLLNRLFGGNEYRLLDDAVAPDPRRKKVWLSPEPFSGSHQDIASGFYYSFDRGPSIPGALCAQAVWPEWMSFRAFNRGR
jgi:hypothetical protein